MTCIGASISRLLGAVLVMATAGAGTASAAFVVTNVDYPGAVSTTAYKINDAGQVVGIYIDAAGVRHGFLLSGGSYSSIDCPSPYTAGSEANGINNLGQIVGVCSAPGGINGVYGTSRSFRVDAGVLTFLSDVPAGSYGGGSTFAQAINDNGDIVGWYADATLSNGHAFLLKGGVYTTFDVPGFGSTYAYGINTAGQIVGATQPTFGGGADRGYLLSGGTFTMIDDPNAAAANGTSAMGLNDAGQIVGAYTDASNVQHGFLFMGGVYTTLDVSGGQLDSVQGNSSAQVAGGYRDASNVDHGFVLTLCEDAVSLKYAGGTLTIGFTLKTTSSASWSAWLGVPNQAVTLWSGVTLPAIQSPVSFSVPISGFPAIGPVYVVTSLATSGGSFCASWKLVNTGL